MAEGTARHASTAGEVALPAPVPAADRVANHWGLVLAYGLVSVGLGLILAVWPGETLKVVAVLIAIQLLIAGVFRIVLSIGARGVDGGVRALMAITGALAIIVGLLCLRDPAQTLLVIGILIGMWWVVTGVVDVIGALVSPVPGRRGWDITTGLISVLAGGFLLINPKLSLGVLVVIVCIWMFLIGGLALVAAFKLRSQLHHAPAATGPAAAPAV
ncbi:MAG TPA: DUF308 domain-containing protein [Nocardioides sp.]|uniref:HdeD family acid-resistance protein n=1 Tax=uncultured Nocardioides sp. TaxID=198441 RepID=UPI0026390274|nr:DUF308 domain-containing protein [uncultured Nocardioides sp.]HRD59995.1 DUF308 domain-containing protein [Nocardioides sp.]HRI94575.1 DUF308 domain-containing protein [Nocardioides sp.]HRK44448.1 DUF308 domain-containing protein [Nocardioides sp.]